MNVVGPCLSPVSLAVEQFHRPKPKVTQPINIPAAVNPMIARRIVYSPPLSRRLKRKRTQFEDDVSAPNDMIIINDKQIDEDIPTPKKPKLNQSSFPHLAVGKQVRVRFGALDSNTHPEPILASVVLTENFGTLVLIKEENPDLPHITAYSKHWARWRGEIHKGCVILDAIHPAE